MISIACSLSHTWERFSSLTHAPQWLSVCVINREAHSLFIFFHSLIVHFNMSAPLNNYLLEPTSLEYSNNPSAPQLVGTLPSDQQGGLTLKQMWGLLPRLTMEGYPQWLYMTCLHYWISRSKHLGMTSLSYITDTSWNKHRGTIYKWIHFEVTNTSTLPLN